MKRNECIFLSAFLVWGCHSQTSSNTTIQPTVVDTVKHTQASAKPIDKGMTDTVYCLNDASNKYAVYIPPAYDAHKKWPIIYFFDPHGVGNLPLRLYKDLADKYGYILAGTYESKNGQQWQVTEKAVQDFMQDTWQRLSVDNNRIYTYGFSGGARVACSVALYDGGIAGVVACGGGFPERNPAIRQPFAFMGFVGDKDFNYTEMKMLDKSLDNSSLQHQLIVYHGKHQWPPVSVAEQAIWWMEVNAMRQHVISKNDTLIKAIDKEFMKEASKAKNKVQQYFAYKKLVNYLNGLEDNKYNEMLTDLGKTDVVKQYMQSEDTNLVQEIKVQREYIDFLSSKDVPWWQNTVKNIRDVVKIDSLAPAALQNQRLLSYLSLATYMGAKQAFDRQNDAAAAHFLEIYTAVDPTNPEHSYLYACIYARENNPSKAISSLQDAVKLGFNDVRRIQQDSNFVALKDQAVFKELVKKIEAMPPRVDVTQ